MRCRTLLLSALLVTSTCGFSTIPPLAVSKLQEQQQQRSKLFPPQLLALHRGTSKINGIPRSVQNDTTDSHHHRHLTIEEVTPKKKPPSYRELLLFTTTTMLIWLSEPLLSIVDTTVVGLTQSDSVLQLVSVDSVTFFFCR